MRIERTLQRTVIAALGLSLFSAVLLLVAVNVKYKWLSDLLSNVASFLIASVILALIFELWQRKTFLEEVFAEAGIVEQVKTAGIEGFSDSFHENIAWNELFARSNRLDALFSYASTWRNVHQQKLEEMLKKENSRLRAVMPDPENDIVIAELAHRFQSTPGELRTKIAESLHFLVELGGRYPGKVEVYFLARSLVYTFYKFNDYAVVALYKHGHGRGGVPSFTIRRGGKFFSAIENEWRVVSDQGIVSGISRKVYPAESPASAGYKNS